MESGCGHVNALFIVEHYAETVLPIVDRATIVLVNGKIAFEGDAGVMERDSDLQARLLGVVHRDDVSGSVSAAAT